MAYSILTDIYAQAYPWGPTTTEDSPFVPGNMNIDEHTREYERGGDFDEFSTAKYVYPQEVYTERQTQCEILVRGTR